MIVAAKTNDWIISLLSTIIISVGLLGWLMPKLVKWYNKYKFFRTLPSHKYSPIFGNVHLMPKDPEGMVAFGQKCMEEFHPKFSVIWMTSVNPHVIVYHPDSMRPVYVSSHAPKPRGLWKSYELMTRWLGEGLVTSNGQTWSRSRKLLNPSFHSSILKNYIEVYNRCADKLIEKLDEYAETGESFDIFPLITKCTLEIILKCILGYDADVQGYTEDDGYHPYARAVLDLSETWVQRFWNPLIWPDFIFNKTQGGKKFIKDCDFVHKIADDIIEKRRKLMENGETPQGKRMEFIDILLSARDEDDQPMTSLEIRNQVDTFMFAGHDTTATSLSFSLYNLAKHQEYQTKVIEEIDSILEGRDSDDISYEDLSEFKTMSLCTKESKRLFAPVPITARILSKDTEIDGVTIPSGTTIHMATVHMHRNPAVWDRPHDFVPERFLTEDAVNWAFQPFAAGPRSCIGKNFAMNEELVLLSRIFNRFNLKLADGYEGPIRRMGAIMKADNGIWLTVSKRQGAN